MPIALFDGPSHQPQGGFREGAVAAWVSNQWVWGYPVRWFCESQEWREHVNVVFPMFYHEHERRGAHQHDVTLKVKKFGKQRTFEDLNFGTQVQVYRRAVAVHQD